MGAGKTMIEAQLNNANVSMAWLMLMSDFPDQGLCHQPLQVPRSGMVRCYMPSQLV